MVLIMGWDTYTGIERIRYFDPFDGIYHVVSYSGFCYNSYNGAEYSASVYVN